ncbi:hypothetical protein BDN72DRAFT_900699 [Pluteus cervinus]|uniref:Uncharacterized protein n=1 Tax=Pluteus cervinus TaxID=181527 RepID=A0ACD3AJM6_9AGAR|nr:hypothetical protein BDN72DRAFT_900699 [Pluteus cervinus]
MEYAPSRSTFTYDPITRTAGHHNVWIPPPSTYSSPQARPKYSLEKKKTPPPLPSCSPPLPSPLKPPTQSAALRLVLNGEQHLVTHDDTEGSNRSGGVSACGLAALNCARIVFKKFNQGVDGTRLLEDVMNEQTVKQILSIRSMLAGSAHLELDEIAELPIFSSCLNRLDSHWGRATHAGFNEMLKRLEDVQQHPIVVMIVTKSPDIIACLRITIEDKHVFVIFDPHPRPSHPNGSGLIIDADRERFVDHLTELLGIDEDLFNDPELARQMEILSSFSDHCFIPTPENPDLESLIIQLSVQSLNKEHNTDEQMRPIREERDRLAAQIKELRTVARAQLAEARAYRQEVEEIREQEDVQRSVLIQEIQRLRSQVREGKTTNEKLSHELQALKYNGIQIDC